MSRLRLVVNSLMVALLAAYLLAPFAMELIFPYSLEEEICMEVHRAVFAPDGPYGEIAPMGLSEEELAAWELELAARGDAHETEQVAAVAERYGLSVEEVEEIYLREMLRPGSRCL
jgi:hypothetical protein